jgi:hypothetical protein
MPVIIMDGDLDTGPDHWRRIERHETSYTRTDDRDPIWTVYMDVTDDGEGGWHWSVTIENTTDDSARRIFGHGHTSDEYLALQQAEEFLKQKQRERET